MHVVGIPTEAFLVVSQDTDEHRPLHQLYFDREAALEQYWRWADYDYEVTFHEVGLPWKEIQSAEIQNA